MESDDIPVLNLVVDSIFSRWTFSRFAWSKSGSSAFNNLPNKLTICIHEKPLGSIHPTMKPVFSDFFENSRAYHSLGQVY